MSKLQIGRFGVHLISGEVQSLSDDGSQVALTGVTAYANRVHAEVLRQQLLGLRGVDEPFVPCVWDEQPEFGGFYRVLSVSVSGSRGLAPQGVWDFTVELERVTGFAAPLMELRNVGAERSNTTGATPVRAYAVPEESGSVGFYDLDLETWIPFYPDVVRVGVDGGVSVYAFPEVYNMLSQFYLPPERHYLCAATLMMGDQLSVVVGRQVRNSPGVWRISNGLYEIQAGPGPDFTIQHRMWLDGWTPWVTFTFLSQNWQPARVPMLAPHSITVLRNGPEQVIVRLLTTTEAGYSPVTVDISVKRGSRFAGVELSSVFTSGFAVSCPVFSSSPEVWMAQGDSDGVRTLLGSNQDINRAGTVVVPYESMVMSVKEWSFMLAAADATESGTSKDGAAAAHREWLFAGSEKQTVVVQ